MDLRAITLNILVAIFIILALMVLIDVIGINMNLPQPINKQLKQIVTIEGLDMNLANDFCSTNLGKSSCEKLTDKNCNNASCCVLLNGNHCVPGSEDGPTFKTSKGEKINVDFYYHQNKCYGDNCLNMKKDINT